MSVNNVLTPYDTVIDRLDLYLIMYMSFPVALSFVLLAAFHHKALDALHVQKHFRPTSAQKIHLFFTLVAASITLTLEVSVGFIFIGFVMSFLLNFTSTQTEVRDRIFSEAVCDVG